MKEKDELDERAGRHLQRLRRKRELKYDEFIDELKREGCSVGESTIKQRESGHQRISPDHRPAVRNVLGADPYQLAQLDHPGSMAPDLLRALNPYVDSPLDPQHVKKMAIEYPEVASATLGLADARDVALRERHHFEDRLSPNVSRRHERAVDELIHRCGNYFPQLDESAEHVRDQLDDVGDLEVALTQRLQRYGVETVFNTPIGSSPNMREYRDGRLYLSEALRRGSRTFHLAYQLAFHEQSSKEIERLVAEQIRAEDEVVPENHAAAELCRSALANYYAGAILMPYRNFREQAIAVRYDVEILGHRFGASLEQICHRLTTLRRPGEKNVGFHMVKVNEAGAILKRFSASGLEIDLASPICARWNLWAAFQTPGVIRVQLSKLTDKDIYLCIAFAVRKESLGFHSPRPLVAISLGCRLEDAGDLVYAAGLDLKRRDDLTNQAIAIGVSCADCKRDDCSQRSVPNAHETLSVDEYKRGTSVYSR